MIRGLEVVRPYIHLALLAIGFGCGWLVHGWKVGSENYKAVEYAQNESRSLQEKIRELDAKGVKENEDAKRKINDLQRRIASGELRLTVPARCKAVDTREANGEERAELDPKASGDIVAIAADGDQAIRDLTELQNICQKIASK